MLRDILLTKFHRISLLKTLFNLHILFCLNCLKEVSCMKYSKVSLHVVLLFQFLFIFFYGENLLCFILLDKICSNIITSKKVKLFCTNFCCLNCSRLGYSLKLSNLFLHKIVTFNCILQLSIFDKP